MFSRATITVSTSAYLEIERAVDAILLSTADGSAHRHTVVETGYLLDVC